jgi:hypothetical protein
MAEAHTQANPTTRLNDRSARWEVVEPVRALPQILPTVPHRKRLHTPRMDSRRRVRINDQWTEQFSPVRSPFTLQLEARVESREQVRRVQWRGGLELV